jgi:hypothetical protein
MSPQTEAHHHLLPHRQLPALKTHCVLPIFIFPALVNNATTAIPANSPSPMRVMSTYRVVEKLHGMADIIDPFPFAVDDQRSPLPCHRLSSPPPQHCQHRCRRLRFSFVDMELRGDPPELGKHGDLHLVASSPVAAASPPPLVRNPPPLVAPLLPCATTTTTLPGDFALTASALTADRVPPEPPFRRQPPHRHGRSGRGDKPKRAGLDQRRRPTVAFLAPRAVSSCRPTLWLESGPVRRISSFQFLYLFNFQKCNQTPKIHIKWYKNKKIQIKFCMNPLE